MSWSKKVCKIAVSFLLIIGLKQNLLFYLCNSQQQEKPKLMAFSCACDPSTCMCPPSNGCHHQREKNIKKQKKQITICYAGSNNRNVIESLFIEWKEPILAQRLNSLAPDLSFIYLERSPFDSFSQQFLSPLDKPPQTSFI